MEKIGESNYFYFSYNTLGNLSYLCHENNGTIVGRYQVICNSRGDVVALHSHSTGALYATYTYDTWGNVISVKDSSGNDISSSTNTANLNPIRYRGYYYDSETGFYYLKSRYYDPVTARFINADAYMGEVGDAISHNLFAYCLNNPVVYSDPSGFNPFVATAGVLGVSITTIVVTTYLVMFMVAIAGVQVGFLETMTEVIGGFGRMSKDTRRKIELLVAMAMINAVSYLKPINLPSYKKVSIDMPHIWSGHGSGGNRGGPNKDRFPPWMTYPMAEKAIREAYRVAEKLETQGDRVRVIGYSETYGFFIEMWVNIKTKVIETAYPRY